MNTKEIFQKNIEAVDLVNEMILLFRKQNFNRGDRLFPAWIRNFSALVGIFFAEKKYFNTYGTIAEEADIADMLQTLMQAQEQKDYVLLADLLELRVLPLLYSLQEVIRMQESAGSRETTGDSLCLDYFETNLAYLEKEQPELARQLRFRRGGALLKSFTDEARHCLYELEQTSQGALTLKLTDKNGSYYFHSNHSPLLEAYLLASNYYEDKKAQYSVYGIGLGYHIRALYAECRGGVPITVYESDLNIIVFAMQTANFVPLLQKELRLVYDPDFTFFMKRLQNTIEAPVIHYPSLRNISQETVKKRMEELFVQDSSIRNQCGEMLSNFRNNIKNCGHDVGELSGKIVGKDVYLAAAGPSLDKNIALLRERPENAVLIVVGTALRKLLAAGIRPDYAVFLDASDRIYAQLAGLEKESVPLLIASTACRRLAENYQGPAYLIFQKEFEEAERHAKEHGCRTYMTGGSVATIAFDIALRLGAKRIIAIGLDLAYTGNKLHAVGAGLREVSEDSAGLIPTGASDGGTVYTTQAMEMYRRWFEKRIERAVSEMPQKELPEFINATEGGAYIAGMQCRTLRDVIADTYL
ncbi:MAG: DUF115 domain-containing protein [Lachnospiraceae bacterium]